MTASNTKGCWLYARQRGGARFEYARCAGGAIAPLGMHFHDESQLALALDGNRAFQLGAQVVQVPMGHCLYIPAGMPHRSLPNERARCLNLYVSYDRLPRCHVIFPLPASERCSNPVEGDDIDAAKLVALIGCRRLAIEADEWARDDLLRLVRPDDGTRIGTIAARLGVSRETFTRSFCRRVGMSPHAFRIVGRLNLARDRIRNGASIADAAADCGFADQSHLGRHFRRVFGVTPREYLETMR